MNKKSALEALKKAKTESQKRNFNQSVDFIISLKGLDLKKTENQIDLFLQLHNPTGKKSRICALVGPELLDQAKSSVDLAIMTDDFEKYASDKKLTKKLSNKFDYFIGQANIMPKIAAAFGRVLGPRGKMPNPKAGCIVPPNASLKQLVQKLQKTIRIVAKTTPNIHTLVGKEDMDENLVVDNMITVYDSVLHALPNGDQNIRGVYVKLTMGKPVRADR